MSAPVWSRVCSVFEDRLHIDEMNMHGEIIGPGMLDSLDVIDLHYHLEEEFKIEIPEEVMFSFRTAEEIVAYIEKRLPNSNTA